MANSTSMTEHHKTKQQRREEAAERQARYDALTLTEKVARAWDPMRPGDCMRERARLGEQS